MVHSYAARKLKGICIAESSKELSDVQLLQLCPLHIAMPSVGDRMVTPWLKLLGKGAPDPPMLHIALKRAGSSLKKAKAEVRCVMTRLLYALVMSMCPLPPIRAQELMSGSLYRA